MFPLIPSGFRVRELKRWDAGELYGVYIGLYKDDIGVILGLYRDSEKKMETTVLRFRVLVPLQADRV